MIAVDLSKTLIIDIETVPQYADYHEMDEKWQKLWDKKAASFIRNMPEPQPTPDELYFQKSGIFAEFGKVICISCGYFVPLPDSDDAYGFRIKSFAGKHENLLLGAFSELLNNSFNQYHHFLCGHNAREFDFPFIARRMLIRNIQLPRLLDVSGKKPWETKWLIDTMDMWRFGDFKNYTSLSLMAEALGVPTPKDDISGEQVPYVFYKEDNLERIKTYCQKDVLATGRLLQRLLQKPMIQDSNVKIVA